MTIIFSRAAPDLDQIWVFCGFSFVPKPDDLDWFFEPKGGCIRYSVRGSRWITPDGQVALFTRPDWDLVNIYEYLIPFLQDRGVVVTLVAHEHKGYSCSCDRFTRPLERPTFHHAEAEGAILYSVWDYMSYDTA